MLQIHDFLFLCMFNHKEFSCNHGQVGTVSSIFLKLWFNLALPPDGPMNEKSEKDDLIYESFFLGYAFTSYRINIDIVLILVSKNSVESVLTVKYMMLEVPTHMTSNYLFERDSSVVGFCQALVYWFTALGPMHLV